MTDPSERAELRRLAANGALWLSVPSPKRIIALLGERDALEAEVRKLREALKPFAEPHFMGDNYVKFAPRLIEAARAALSTSNASEGDR